MVKKKQSSYEDLQSDIRDLKMPEIEVWENKYSDREYIIHLDVPECTCICPKTGLPDFVHLKISYIPRAVCIELKSLKLYIVEYRNVGIFHEHITNKVMDDFVAACDPQWVRVESIVMPRGGIQTTVVSEYQRKKRKR